MKCNFPFPKTLRNRLLIIAAIIALVICIIFVINHQSKLTQPSTLAAAQQHRNIQYCNDTDTARQLDLYIPKNVKTKPPLLIFIHGGGWRSGSRSGGLAQLHGGAAIGRGIAVADIGYRLNATDPYPAENIDVACALTWLTDHGESYGIDTETMIYFGDSAGGQLAAFAALNIPFKGYDYESPIGVIDLYGVSDFTKIIGGKHPDKNAQLYLGSSYNTKAVGASPTTYVTKNAPRFLIIHGTKDTVVPIAQSKDFFDKLTRFGIDAEYVEIKGAGHGFTGSRLPRVERVKMETNIATFLKELTGR